MDHGHVTHPGPVTRRGCPTRPTLATLSPSTRTPTTPATPATPRLLTGTMALVDATNAQDDSDARAFPPSPDAVVQSLTELASSAYLSHDPNLVHIRAGALFARLKALNRAANVATRTRKQTTTEMRHDMDQTYLSLQNLLYEKRHLEREIEKCRQFA